MTIALGILTSQGVVIAADRQMTVAGYMKLDEGKVSGGGRFIDTCGPISFAIGGAGDSTAMTHLRQGFTSFIQGATRIDDLSDIHRDIARQAAEFHKEHVIGTESLAAQMLVGATTRHQKKLWVTDRGVTNEENSFAAIGAGEMYARTILGRLYAPMNTIGAILLSAYVIHEVNKTIDTCGNGADIFVAGFEGPVFVSENVLAQLVDVFERFSRLSRNILHDVFNDSVWWDSQAKRNHSSEIRKLRSEVRKIVDAMQSIPTWARREVRPAPQVTIADLLHQRPSPESPGGSGES